MNSQRTTNNNTGKNIQILHALEIKADTVLNGTLLITNSFTIHSGAICTMHNTFIFADSAGILVKDGAGLRISGAHLSCPAVFITLFKGEERQATYDLQKRSSLVNAGAV